MLLFLQEIKTFQTSSCLSITIKIPSGYYLVSLAILKFDKSLHFNMNIFYILFYSKALGVVSVCIFVILFALVNDVCAVAEVMGYVGGSRKWYWTVWKWG